MRYQVLAIIPKNTKLQDIRDKLRGYGELSKQEYQKLKISDHEFDGREYDFLIFDCHYQELTTLFVNLISKRADASFFARKLTAREWRKQYKISNTKVD